ncbi:MAG: hypothetical protein NBV67_11335 [Tagaea sp.]|nr:hypothetical protein [Tagaea sp.]
MPSPVESPADTLISVAARLVVCLEKETALLVDMKMQEIAELAAEKTELVRTFMLCVRNAREQAAILKSVGPAVMAEVEAAVAKVEDVATRNARALASARTVNEGVMKAIAAALNEKRVAAAGYTKAGAKPLPLAKKAAYTYQPMVLDERC